MCQRTWKIGKIKTMEIQQYLAHVKQDDHGLWKIHELDEHLREVAKLAEKMAATFGASDWAKLAGLWHDLGKYRSAFQNYIKKASGYDPEAHIENGQGRVDHSTAGALHALEKLPVIGRVLAYLIAGHHAGLPDWDRVEAGASALSVRLDEGKKKNYLAEVLTNAVPDDILNVATPAAKPLGGSEGLHLWIRMLFSCLVDADFLDTETFMSPEKTDERGSFVSLELLKSHFDKFIKNKTDAAEDTPVNRIRGSILHDCRNAAQGTKGIYTLTVPTGGGKTLSGMAFALGHAVRHGMSRIIVAIPYTSIIEQTAEQYRQVFGDAVLEHHSNLDTNKESSKSRLAAENWDSPIVVTTNVQLLESLFSAKASRCRKLHNIANSVIVIDEAQLLPPEFLQPVLDVLRQLVEHYGVTLVLSTATQPALATRKSAHGKTLLKGLDNAKEIISDVPALYQSLNRVNVEKPDDMNIRVTWESLVENLKQHDSVLAIVNTRKDCRQLFELMPKDTIHLSALMCGEHRSKVIAEIKHKLKAGESVRVVSTQLVEAGVDLDFPVVYRALAGLDSIAQAAGRCNREGKLEKGKIVVFVPPSTPPKGMLTFGDQATRSVWHDRHDDLLSQQLYESYFQQYFGSVDVDQNRICELLYQDAQQCVIQFRSAAEKFRLIDDKDTSSILIPYGFRAEGLIRALKFGDMSKRILRQLQRYSVTVYENEFRKLRDMGVIEQIQPDIWAVCVTNAYDEKCGLLLADDIYAGDAASSVM
jgi:CRISPR-associated endonuclease/helicase Cas3